MRIAVIADTHGKLPPPLIEALRPADEIWHLGDFCDPDTLAATRRIGPPVEAVLGNNDYGLRLPLERELSRGGHAFRLIHIPPPPARIGGDGFLLHGHTHVPRDEMVNGVRVLNPGTIGKPNKGAPPAYAWLEIDAAGVRWTVFPVPR